MKALLILLLLPTAWAVTFDEPASVSGEISTSGTGRLFLEFGEGEVLLNGNMVSALEERTMPRTGNTGAMPGYAEETDRRHVEGAFEGSPFASSTVELTGSWDILGEGSTLIWDSAATCEPNYIRYRSAVCSQIGSPWAKLTLTNPQINIRASQSNWTDLNWDNGIPDSKYENEITDAGVYYAGYTVIRTNQLHGAHHIAITAPSVTMYVGLPNFKVDGSIELPNYNDADKSAPNLVVEGVFQFSNMTFKDGRFQADMSGDVEAARLDNEIVSADSLGLAAIGVASSAAVTVLIWKTVTGTLIAGFTRMTMEDALEHPKRRVVYDYILSAPGATFREVVRETGYATGTTRHHLTILKRSNAIMEQKYLQTLRYYENHGRYNDSWDSIALLREEPLSLLHSWLLENPDCNQKAILAAMGERGWSRSTAQHRLSRLVEGGLVSLRPQGRMNIYVAHKSVQR